jgi:hypothetical protein
MTMPHERTRSLIEAEKVLLELRRDPHLSNNIKEKIDGVLRHYPTEEEIINAGKFEFLARQESNTLNLVSPFLSPSTTYEGEQDFIVLTQNIQKALNVKEKTN